MHTTDNSLNKPANVKNEIFDPINQPIKFFFSIDHFSAQFRFRI